MAKNKSDFGGCLEIIIVIVFICGIPYSITLIILLLVIGVIIHIYEKITGKKSIVKDTKENKQRVTINRKKIDIENTNDINSIPQIDCKSIRINEIDSKKEWKDEYGVEYSNNGQILENYSPNINLTKYKVIEGCKIIKRFSFNKELGIDNSECVEIFTYGNNLKTIILPNTIEIIEEDAFYGCDQLQTIIIPNGMIDYFTFICPSMGEFFIEQDEKMASKLIDNNIFLTQELEEYIDKYNFYIQNECEILFSFFEDIKIKKTTGENEIYKEKLKDSRWIKLSCDIKKRDHFCCQHCFNIQKLNSIYDLYEIVDFKEVAVNVISLFNQLKFGNSEFKAIHIADAEFKSKYVKKYGFWLTKIREKRNNILEDAYIGDSRISYSTISNSEFVLSNEYVYYLKEFDCPMRYKTNNGLIAYIDKLLVERSINNNNFDKLYLYHRIDYENKLYCDFTGKATLYFNEYAITFPLWKLKSCDSLNVHHIRYADSGNPWDVNESDLITLCQKCHILEHQS